MTMMSEVAACGGGFAAASTIHSNLFGPHPIVVKGSPEQKARWGPRLVAGADQCCFGFTEPEAGPNTTRIKTFAEKVPGGDLVQAQKVWTSTARVENPITLQPRTAQCEPGANTTAGSTNTYTALERNKSDSHLIPKPAPKHHDH